MFSRDEGKHFSSKYSQNEVWKEQDWGIQDQTLRAELQYTRTQDRLLYKIYFRDP